MRKTAPTSNYDFAHLINNKMNYVDKSDYLHRLVTTDNTCIFLSRPRRFGKSLTISCLKYIFEGRRDLFAGLMIDEMAYDWKEYPVVHLNMAMGCSSVLEFKEGLLKQLANIANDLQVTINSEETPGSILNDILRNSAHKSATKQVVLLVDEFDAPLVNNIGKPHLEEIRTILDNFYIQIKNANSILRFTFITGVTRYTKVSVFSKLNNMVDISMSRGYATILGYTQQEVEYYFGDRLEELAINYGISYTEMRDLVKRWYNGYRFHHEAETVYNPVSVGRFMEEGEFDNWWFETGTPTFLLNVLKKKESTYFDLLHEPVSKGFLNTFEPTKLDARSLLFQTGYLTITEGVNGKPGRETSLRLGFPNAEVEHSYASHLVAALGTEDSELVRNYANRLADAVEEGDIPKVVRLLQSHLAAIPYDGRIQSEGVFKSMIFLLLRMAGLFVTPERYSNLGRMDTAIETPDAVYIFEYKYKKSAAEAMQQIVDKRYAQQYVALEKPIYLIAMNYDLTIHNIGDDWFMEEYKPE